MGLVTYDHVWAGPHEQAPEPINKELCQERERAREGNVSFKPETRGQYCDSGRRAGAGGNSFYSGEVQSHGKATELEDQTDISRETQISRPQDWEE